MKEVSLCYMCGAKKYEILFSQKIKDPYYDLIYNNSEPIDMTWVRCQKCSFTFRMQQLTEDETEILYLRYRNIMLSKETPVEYFNRITTIPDEDSENYEKSTIFRKFIKRYLVPSKRRHLDIGAGAGVFIYTFNIINPGWQSYAIEATPIFAKTIHRQLGIEVHEGFYQSGIFWKKFQLITILQVFEHIYDPRSMLTDIKTDLDEGGLLIIEVPSASNINILSPTHDIFCIPHYCLYSTNTLCDLLLSLDFKVLSSGEVKSKRGINQVHIAATAI